MRGSPLPRDYWHKLYSLYSFVKAEDIQDDDLCKTLLTSDESLIGAYINTGIDLILFTTRGLHWVRGGIGRFIPYPSIMSVDLPEDTQYRELKLLLQDGSMIFLTVANETEEIFDLHNIYDFLMAEIYYPFTGWNNEIPLETVSSASELASFLGQLDHVDLETIVALRDGRPTDRQLRMFGIDPEVLNRPDTWRLIAAFLSIPKSDRKGKLFAL